MPVALKKAAKEGISSRKGSQEEVHFMFVLTANNFRPQTECVWGEMVQPDETDIMDGGKSMVSISGNRQRIAAQIL